MMNKLMKKIAIVIAAAAMSITAMGCIASADEAKPFTTCAMDVQDCYDIRYVNVNDALNVRSYPQTNASVIGSLANGDCVEVTGQVSFGGVDFLSNWVRINFNGQVGYVDGEFLTWNPVPTPQPAPQPIPQPTPDPTPVTPTEIDTVVYPRVDRQLQGAYTTWCSLNTDGFYYNENGARFTDLGNGTFMDAQGNILNVIA